MAEKSKNTEEKTKDLEGLESLFEFTGGFRSVAETFKTEGLIVVKRLKKQDEDIFAGSFGFLEKHVDGLCRYIEDVAEKASVIQKLEIKNMMKYNAGIDISHILKLNISKGFQKGLASNLLEWIYDNINELKKINRLILDLLEELFGITIPGWVTYLIELIDQLTMDIIRMLIDLFGGDVERITQRLHIRNENFVNELLTCKKYNLIGKNIDTKEDR